MDQGHVLHGIAYIDICFTCSFVVTLRYFEKNVLPYMSKTKKCPLILWDKIPCSKDEVLCRIFKTIMNDLLDGNADLKC